jgi:hypothetical protein
MTAAAAAPEDPHKKPAKHIHKHYTIHLIVNVKRGKEEMDFVNKESDRLYKLIEGGTEAEWAKRRLEKVQDMVLNPAEQISTELSNKLTQQDKEETLEVESDGVNE